MILRRILNFLCTQYHQRCTMLSDYYYQINPIAHFAKLIIWTCSIKGIKPLGNEKVMLSVSIFLLSYLVIEGSIRKL